MDDIQNLVSEAERTIQSATSTSDLRDAEIRYLGKSGLITGLMRGIGGLSPEERPKFGQRVNEARSRIESLLAEREPQIKAAEHERRFENERIDVTLPSRPLPRGYEHVLQQTENRIREVLGGMGFQYFEGPELEDFRYNFDVLNYPPDHPAIDEQDTFYLADDKVLRTQCTAIQGRVFERFQPPLRFFTVGRTFRNEAVDRTHSHTFHQVDAFMVDEGVSMAHLKGTLGVFTRAMFGDEVEIRFRPDFFPFVEPGVDYAISTPKLFGGAWLELGGAGLIHPKILESFGIDTERYSGWAFGLGVERIPMMDYGVEDLRFFLENDLRFLGQFRA
ncbi:MAG TPA: phenylalanine--tRNA ligase subunit alpha [Fimbriimonadaceae bacterium]|nr:phenylalanine--tRNA ligase subunit alpha [Fimbriimonadaceae bacterium]